jgi:cytochrome c biogenesis protein CcmG/thiol:disulfide interchange protein DsbE
MYMAEDNTEIVSKAIISRVHFPWGRLLAWLGLLAFLIMLSLGLLRNQQGSVGVGETIPNFTLKTFDGQQISLADQKGKVVVINFWASWCKPCEDEAAALEQAWHKYKPDGKVVFLGIDYADTEPQALAFLKKFAVTYPNGPDLRTAVSQLFRITGVPETYILDREGRLQYAKKGPFQSVDEITSVVDGLLK